MITLAERLTRHYAAKGQNAAIVVRQCDEGYNVTKITELQFREGRLDEGEKLQIEISISKNFRSGRSASQFASVSLSPELWNAIVEHVKQARDI